MELEAIRAPVLPDLKAADSFIYNEILSTIPLVNDLIDYIMKCGGKRIRPLLVLLSAKALSYSHKLHIHLAAAIELIHTATLLHDDVVDEANVRRGKKTANAIWGNQMSVLVGDFLYSRAFQLIVNLNHLPILGVFSNATNLIAEGEVLQLMNCNNPDTTEKAYFDVIERKTAKLFEVATVSGSTLGDATLKQQQAMQHYGKCLGMAYQLIDDALDYEASFNELGKRTGQDLEEGKPTLPLIHALKKSTPKEATLIRQAIKQSHTKNFGDILAIIESTKAIEYTKNIAQQEAENATKYFNNIPDSCYKKALYELAEFVVARKS